MEKVKQFDLRKPGIYSFVKYLGGLGIAIAVGMLLLIAVYMLPVDNMKTNVARSSEIFNYEGIYPQLVNGYKYMQLDNYTDSIMLGAAIYDGPEGTVDKAVNNYHPDSRQLSPELALTNYANGVTDYEYFRVHYGRYWHGYLVILKLLLLFFDYADIRVLNFFMQSFLLFIVLKLLGKVRLEQYIPAFLITVFVINPLTSAMSLQFSSVYYMVLLSSICLLWLVYKGKAEESRINGLFFITGILTAYLDFLTYPLASFGILFVLYLIINGETGEHRRVKDLFQKILLWGFGYGGMWSGKWLVGSILTKRNIFADALNQIMVRTSLNSLDVEKYNRLEALIKNISVYMKWPFLLAFAWEGVFFALGLRKLTRTIVRQNVTFILSLAVAAFLPVIWILIVAEHSVLHYWFTCKEFSISGFAVLSLGIYLKSLAYTDESEKKRMENT